MRTLSVLLFFIASLIFLVEHTRDGCLWSALFWALGALAAFRIKPECNP